MRRSGGADGVHRRARRRPAVGRRQVPGGEPGAAAVRERRLLRGLPQRGTGREHARARRVRPHRPPGGPGGGRPRHGGRGLRPVPAGGRRRAGRLRRAAGPGRRHLPACPTDGVHPGPVRRGRLRTRAPRRHPGQRRPGRAGGPGRAARRAGLRSGRGCRARRHRSRTAAAGPSPAAPCGCGRDAPHRLGDRGRPGPAVRARHRQRHRGALRRKLRRDVPRREPRGAGDRDQAGRHRRHRAGLDGAGPQPLVPAPADAVR